MGDAHRQIELRSGQDVQRELEEVQIGDLGDQSPEVTGIDLDRMLEESLERGVRSLLLRMDLGGDGPHHGLQVEEPWWG